MKSGFEQTSTGLCESFGKVWVENLEKKGVNLKEAMRLREDVNLVTGSGLYTTALATVLQAASEPFMVGKELLKENRDLMGGKGKGAIKIPKDVRTVAVEVAEGAVVNYFTEGMDSITVTPTKKLAGTKITWEIQKRGMDDTARIMIERAGKAIARKMDSDIIASIIAAIDADATIKASNRIATGGTTTYISWTMLTNCEAAILGAVDTASVPFGFVPTHLLFHPRDWAKIQQDTDFKNMIYRHGIVVGEPLTVNPPILYYSTMKITVTGQITTGSTLMVDAENCGQLIKESDIEVYEGRLPGSVDIEVIALMSYGIGILFPQAAAYVKVAAS